jgi:hypothetical protein
LFSFNDANDAPWRGLIVAVLVLPIAYSSPPQAAGFERMARFAPTIF